MKYVTVPMTITSNLVVCDGALHFLWIRQQKFILTNYFYICYHNMYTWPISHICMTPKILKHTEASSASSHIWKVVCLHSWQLMCIQTLVSDVMTHLHIRPLPSTGIVIYYVDTILYDIHKSSHEDSELQMLIKLLYISEDHWSRE